MVTNSAIVVVVVVLTAVEENEVEIVTLIFASVTKILNNSERVYNK